MSMNVNTTTPYANYQNNYKTGSANKKKETPQTTENTKLTKNTTESIAEKISVKRHKNAGEFA